MGLSSGGSAGRRLTSLGKFGQAAIDDKDRGQGQGVRCEGKDQVVAELTVFCLATATVASVATRTEEASRLSPM